MPTHQAENIRTDLKIAFASIADMPGSPYITRYLNLTPSPTIPTDSLRDFLKAYLPTGMTYTCSEKEAHFDDFNAHARPRLSVRSSTSSPGSSSHSLAARACWCRCSS
jgi:hypothetical protein